MRQRHEWGQGRLLAEERPALRFRVAREAEWGPVVGQLALAVAQARAAAAEGTSAVICADDGTAVVVTRRGDGFEFAASDECRWAEQAQRLLTRLS